MFAVQTLLPLVSLALAAAASPAPRPRADAPGVSLPFVKRFAANSTAPLDVLRSDRARAKYFKSRVAGEGVQRRQAGDVPLTNTAVSYMASVRRFDVPGECRSLCCLIGGNW